MGFLERRTFRHAAGAARPGDRYGPRQSHDNGGSNHQPPPPAPSHHGRTGNSGPIGSGPAPSPPEASVPGPFSTEPADPPPTPRAPDLVELLGRSVLEARTQEICRAYGLAPRYGSGLSRWYLSRESGLEVAADAHGTVTAIFLHFHGDDGFDTYRGEIPGAPGAVPHKDGLRAVLGRPHAGGDSYRERYLGDFGPWDRWDLPGLVLHAQYALDAENLHRITLKAPGASGRAA